MIKKLSDASTRLWRSLSPGARSAASSPTASCTWILPMVTTYGISATWLLTGEGDMFVPFFNSMPVTTRKRRVSPSLSPSLQDSAGTPPQTPQTTQKPAVNTH